MQFGDMQPGAVRTQDFWLLVENHYTPEFPDGNTEALRGRALLILAKNVDGGRTTHVPTAGPGTVFDKNSFGDPVGPLTLVDDHAFAL